MAFPQGQEYSQRQVRTRSQEYPQGQTRRRSQEYSQEEIRRQVQEYPRGQVRAQSREYAYPQERGREAARSQAAARSRDRDVDKIRRQREQARRRKRIRQRRRILCGMMGCAAVLAVLLYWQMTKAPEIDGSVLPAVAGDASPLNSYEGDAMQGLAAEDFTRHPAWTENFLTPNEYSRPGEALPEVNSIFVHYTANKGTSAAQNRSYFENLKDSHETSASAHFIIGYNGEIIQCIPLNEIAYAVQTRNYDSVSIECCYETDDASFSKATYDSLVSMLKWLTDVYDLGTDDILRHYDCGGKKCPLYYTEHPDTWEQLKRDVAEL